MILRDGKKINVEDGRVEIVVDGKTRKLIFKVKNNKGIRDAGSTADFRILFEILKSKNLKI